MTYNITSQYGDIDISPEDIIEFNLTGVAQNKHVTIIDRPFTQRASDVILIVIEIYMTYFSDVGSAFGFTSY